MKLINETDKYVEYALYNGNDEFIEKIRFYKDSKFLVIEGKKKMTNTMKQPRTDYC